MSGPGEAADALREEGFTLIPLGSASERPPRFMVLESKGDVKEAQARWSKTPRVEWKQFQSREPTDEEWEEWRTTWPNCNWAIVTGKQIVVVDVDSDEAAAWVRNGGITRPQRWTRTGKGSHFWYAADPAMPIRNSVGKQKIDIRGVGGYVVAPGSVHYSGRLYAPGRNPAWDGDLPTLTAEDLMAIAQFNRGRAGEPAQKTLLRDSHVGEAVDQGMRNATLAASVGAWIKDGLSIDQVRAKSHAWNTALPEPLDATEVDHTVASIMTTHMRNNAPAEVEVELTVATAPPEERENELTPQPFVLGDPSGIPPREFVGGNYAYPRGVAVALVGAGGTAKSSLTIIEAIAMAAGRKLLHVPAAPPVAVAILNLEDSIEELQRRVTAACLHFGVSNEELGGRLYLLSGMSMQRPFVMAEESKSGLTIHWPVLETLGQHMLRLGIEVLHVDPYVSAHRVSENDNGAIDAVTKAWARLAFMTRSCIVLTHHLRKLGGREAGAEDTRGGISMVGAVRLVRVVNRMTERESETAGIADDRWRYFRTVDGKANLTPSSEKSTWYRLESVTLPNGRDGKPGDSVGVVTAWTWPDPFDAVESKHLTKVLQEIGARGINRFRADPRSKDWIGHKAGEIIGIDTSDKGGKAQMLSIVKTWVEKGVIRIEHGLDATRNKRQFINLGEPVNAHPATPRGLPAEDDQDDIPF